MFDKAQLLWVMEKYKLRRLLGGCQVTQALLLLCPFGAGRLSGWGRGMQGKGPGKHFLVPAFDLVLEIPRPPMLTKNLSPP